MLKHVASYFRFGFAFALVVFAEIYRSRSDWEGAGIDPVLFKSAGVLVVAVLLGEVLSVTRHYVAIAYLTAFACALLVVEPLLSGLGMSLIASGTPPPRIEVGPLLQEISWRLSAASAAFAFLPKGTDARGDAPRSSPTLNTAPPNPSQTETPDAAKTKVV